jgi:membrane protease YdiL (CAAX protease family)
MRVIEGLLLFLYCAGLWTYARKDAAEYAAFKLLNKTEDRQRQYRAWILKAVPVYTGSSLIGLALLHRLGALSNMPREFRPLSDSMRIHLPRLDLSADFNVGFGIAVLLGGLIGSLISALAMKKLGKQRKKLVIGDVEALLPRNLPETGYTALLALHAGLGEELCCRVFLPLALTMVSGSPVFAFLAATFFFGAMHLYQGATGVIATTVIGFLFVALYLATGNIWIVIGVHAAIDVLGLVVRPTIMRLVSPKAAAV